MKSGDWVYWTGGRVPQLCVVVHAMRSINMVTVRGLLKGGGESAVNPINLTLEDEAQDSWGADVRMQTQVVETLRPVALLLGDYEPP